MIAKRVFLETLPFMEGRNGPMLPTASDRDRLDKLLALADSDRDAEAIAALRAARDVLSRSGLRLVDVWRIAVSSNEFGDAGTGHEPGGSLGWALDSAHEEVTRLHAVIAGLEDRLAEAQAALQETRIDTRQASAPEPSSAEGVDRLLDGFRRLERRLSADTKAGRRHADIRDAVLSHLEDPETSRLSNREIARRIGVSPQTVCNWRRRITEGQSGSPSEALVTRNGRTYRMRVDRIGRRS